MKKKSLFGAFMAILIIIGSMFNMNIRADYLTDPIVPIDVVQNGRQAVASYLGKYVHHAQVKFVGRSLARSEFHYVSLEELRQHGYIHDGSFTELFEATAHVQFNGRILPTPQGYYDLRVEIEYQSKDNRVLFTGNGYAYVRDGGEKGDGLTATFDPWVWIPDNILVESTWTTGAKWVSGGWNREPQELPVYYLNNTDILIQVSTSFLEDGMILISNLDENGQKLTGYRLDNGLILTGKRLIAELGKSNSSAVQLVKDSVDFSKNLLQAYETEGQVYGRVPLTELVLTNPNKEAFYVSIGVWNSNKTLHPSRIVVEVISQDTNVPGGGLPQEFDLTPIPGEQDGWWGLNLPAGIYHLRMYFPEIKDYLLNPSPAKG